MPIVGGGRGGGRLARASSPKSQHHEHECSYANYDDRDGVVVFEQHVGDPRLVLWRRADEINMIKGGFLVAAPLPHGRPVHCSEPKRAKIENGLKTPSGCVARLISRSAQFYFVSWII